MKAKSPSLAWASCVLCHFPAAALSVHVGSHQRYHLLRQPWPSLW